MTGDATEGVVRIDLLQGQESGDLLSASRLIAEMGGEILGVGTYRDPWSGQPLFYLRVRGVDAGKATATLEEHGYGVLAVH
jgi:hypothetical protein